MKKSVAVCIEYPQYKQCILVFFSCSTHTLHKQGHGYENTTCIHMYVHMHVYIRTYYVHTYVHVLYTYTVYIRMYVQ